MKQGLFIHTAKALVFSSAILLFACSSNPEKADSPTRSSSQDIIFDRAKSAFLANNYKTATALFSNLADKGHAEAQYTLGYMYYYGKGVPKNLKQAMHLFKLSAAQGNTNAVAALSTIQKTVDKNQLETKSDSPPESATTPVVDLRKLPKVPATPEIKQPTPTRPATPEIRHPDPVVSKPTPANSEPETGSVSIIGHEQAQTDASNTDKVIRSTKEVKSANWISSQPAGYYTIQLSSSTSYSKTLDFMRRVELDGVYFFRTTANNVDRFTVIHGSFPKYGMAKAKLDLLKERGYRNVWIRGFRGIKASVSQQ